MEYEDYLIRMDELEPEKARQRKAAEEAGLGKDAQGPKKRISRFRSFLGRTLKAPLVIDFSKDAKSSFTIFPGYRRPVEPKEE